jgi:hypothetical protein
MSVYDKWRTVKISKAVVVYGDTVIGGPVPEPGFTMCVASRSADDARVLLEGFGEFTIPKDYTIGPIFVYAPPYGWTTA